MKVLVANLGSTSFKYSLFDMNDETVIARGRVERIGEASSPCQVEIGGAKIEQCVSVPDHAVAVKQCLAQLTDEKTGCLRNADEVGAIGFKAVHCSGYTGVQKVDEKILDAMEELNELMPAHNPPYVRAMRLLHERLPNMPLVAAFETGFHQTIPDRNRYYGVPKIWADKYDAKRFGFHGASHRYISERTSQILGRDDLKIVSCHLGGSSSLCAINAGKSMAASMGATAQTGLFHNNRVGDFDPFLLPHLANKLGITQDELFGMLASKSGMLGLSGVSADVRDVIEAMENGNSDARLAFEVFVGDIRKYLGAYIVELGGVDVIVFTAGIGENQTLVREKTCEGLENLGIIIDTKINSTVKSREAAVHAPSSRTQIWVIPTNEELVVARQTKVLVS